MFLKNTKEAIGRWLKVGIWTGKGDCFCMDLQIFVSTIVFTLRIIKIIGIYKHI